MRVISMSALVVRVRMVDYAPIVSISMYVVVLVDSPDATANQMSMIVVRLRVGMRAIVRIVWDPATNAFVRRDSMERIVRWTSTNVCQRLARTPDVVPMVCIHSRAAVWLDSPETHVV